MIGITQIIQSPQCKCGLSSPRHIQSIEQLPSS
ncbi:hypothetical protein [Barnesiella intestinihominis]